MMQAFSDTDEATDRAHLELLRGASPGRRLGLALSVSATVVGLSRRGLARAEPGLSRDEIGLRFIERNYGESLAREVRAVLLRGPS
jgi:hypothetical protein